eukprot:jgi/Mesvir1/6204/Mv00886-RA.1
MSDQVFGRNLLAELVVVPQDFISGVVWALPLAALLLVTTSQWALDRSRGLRELRKIMQGTLLPAIRPLKLPALALLAIGAGVGEELLFRGAAMAAVSSWMPQPFGGMSSGFLLAGKSVSNAHVAAVMLSSIAFGLGHAYTPTYFVFATIAGLLFALEYLVTGNMTAPMLTHGLYDFVAFIYMKQIWDKEKVESLKPKAAQLLDIDQRLQNNAIAIEVLQNTAGLTAQAVKDIAAKPAPAGLAGDAPPITTWADMLKQHTTSTTSAVAAQLQRQTLDLREEAELAKRSLNVIVKNLKMEEGENSEKLARAFEREILDRMGLTGEIELASRPPPSPRAGRRKRLEKTLFTLDDDLTLAQQQRRRELWPTYLQLRQTKAGQPVYWKGAAIYVGHKPWQATPSTTAAPATPDAPA